MSAPKIKLMFVFGSNSAARDVLPIREAVAAFRPHLLAPEAHGLTSHDRILRARLDSQVHRLVKDKRTMVQPMLETFYLTPDGQPLGEFGRALHDMVLEHNLRILPIEGGHSHAEPKHDDSLLAAARGRYAEKDESMAIRLGIAHFNAWHIEESHREQGIVSNLKGYLKLANAFYPELGALEEVRVLSSYSLVNLPLLNAMRQIHGGEIIVAEPIIEKPESESFRLKVDIRAAISNGATADDKPLREMVCQFIALEISSR